MAQRSGTIRILIVDDSEEFLAAVREWIAGVPGLEVVAEARSGRDAEQAAVRLGPDLILMDAVLPGVDGFEATRRIKARLDPPAVVILAFHDTLAAAAQARAAGADAFIGKADLMDQLLPAIREIFPGRPQGVSARNPGISR